MEIRENAVYTTREVAELLRISLPTVKRMLKDKRLPSTRIGRQHRFLGKDLLRMLETGTPAAAPPAAGRAKPADSIPRAEPPRKAPVPEPALRSPEEPPAAPQAPKPSRRSAAERDGLKGLSNLELRQRQYMLGKRVEKAVLDDEGRTIAPAGAVVDDRIIRLAKTSRKLLDLFKNLAHGSNQFGALGRENEAPAPDATRARPEEE